MERRARGRKRCEARAGCRRGEERRKGREEWGVGGRRSANCRVRAPAVFDACAAAPAGHTRTRWSRRRLNESLSWNSGGALYTRSTADWGCAPPPPPPSFGMTSSLRRSETMSQSSTLSGGAVSLRRSTASCVDTIVNGTAFACVSWTTVASSAELVPYTYAHAMFDDSKTLESATRCQWGVRVQRGGRRRTWG